MLRTACIVIALAMAVSMAVSMETRALAAPRREAPHERVVLADPDPELLRALRSALAPWKLEVIVDEPPPIDEIDAEARAAGLAARFVVWRREGTLVVFDRDRGSTEERATTAGSLDAVGAASAALSVKTLMRLPPPPVDEPPPPPPPPGRAGAEVRGQLSLAARLARGSTTELGGRLVAAVLVRPLPRLEWRLGLAGDLGPAAEVQQAGFKGTWSDWAVLALMSWTFPRGSWEIEPLLGAGVTSSSLKGTQMSEGRDEHVALPLLRAGVTVRRRFGRWTVGGVVSGDWILGTPTYTRVGSSAQIFEVPSAAVGVGALAAADFGGSGW